ncbi:MAG TPA: hypothetical protein VGM11_12345 [Acidobacteriaceae bacterium]|jgi:hypothetical protein
MTLLLAAAYQPAGSVGQLVLSQRAAADAASSYLPLESWIYPAFDLLIANGYLQSAFSDLRPSTRLDCARLLELERWRFPLHSQQPQANNALTIQLSSPKVNPR